MNRVIVIVFIILLFVSGCNKNSNPLSTGSPKAAFVIDTIKVSAILKIDTASGFPATYFPLRLVYHFEGRQGSLDGLSFSASDLVCNLIAETVAPTPIGLPMSFNIEFKDPSTFLGRDSLFVHISFGGRFWERKNSTIADYGSYSIRDSLWVRLQR